MVAEDRDQATAAGQFNEPLDDAPAVWPPVDVVAQGDDAVLGARLDRFDEGVESRRTTMDITDGDCAGLHGGVASLWGAEFLRELAVNIAQRYVEHHVDPTGKLRRPL